MVYGPSAYANLRPWTRMECARIIAAAGDDLAIDNVDPGDNHQSEAYGLHAAIATEFSIELRHFNGSGTSEIRVDSIYTRYTGIVGTPLDDGYHFGQTMTNDYGRLYGEGSNIVSGASASGSAAAGASYFLAQRDHNPRRSP